MRRGRALQPHPTPIVDDSGRVIASRQLVAATTGRHPDWVRKKIPVVACHIPTGCLLVDLEEVDEVLAKHPARPDRRKVSVEL